MKNWLAWVCGVTLIACGSCAQEPRQSPKRLISDELRPYVSVSDNRVLLERATVYVGDGSEPLKDHSILIEGDIIARIGPSNSMKVPDGTRRIELSGDTVMPGIVGLHNHLHMPGVHLMEFTAPRLYLASGVTTIQTTGSADPLGELELMRAIDAGNVPGPKIFPTAPYITGPGGNAVMDKPASDAAARAFVAEWADRGITWIKLYRHTDPDIAKTIINEAHQQGLKVTGHLCSITFREAAKMGIDSIEHGLNSATDFVEDKPEGECVPSRSSKLDLEPDGPEIGALINVLIEEDVTLTSTLAILESGFPHRPQAQERALRAMSPNLRATYESRQIQLADIADTTTSTPNYWDLITQFERRFASAGGHLVAGPDTGRHVLPGYGDQRNFELFVEAGFSASDAVQIMTHNGAEALGIGDDVGLIREGYRADIIVINGDINEDASNVRSVAIVFKSGAGFDPLPLILDVDGQVGIH